MGEWKERGRSTDYLQTQTVHCRLCGKIIPRRAWVVKDGNEELLFCDADCERLYQEYWLPRYGTSGQ